MKVDLPKPLYVFSLHEISYEGLRNLNSQKSCRIRKQNVVVETNATGALSRENSKLIRGN